MKKSTRFLSLLLSIVMILGIIPVSVLAADAIKYATVDGNLYFDMETGYVTGCDNTVTVAVIPRFINGTPVKGIANWAFVNSPNLKSVIIPEGINEIQYGAFQYLPNLEYIIFRGSIPNSILNDAILDCSESLIICQNGVNVKWNQGFIETTGHQISIPSGYSPIFSASDVDEIRNNPSGKFILMGDVDLSSIENWSALSSFSGELDGNGYSICNLYEYVNGGSSNTWCSFINTNNGTIKNLGLKNATIVASTSGQLVCGGLAAENNGIIKNCYFNGSIVDSGTGTKWVGEIVGYNSGTVQSCHSSGYMIVSSTTGQTVVGGITGYSSGTVTDNINRSHINVTTTSGFLICGGVVGNLTTACSNNQSTGTIIANSTNGTAYAGGIAGNASAIINTSSNAGSISAAGYSRCYAGGIAGYTSAELNRSHNTGNISSTSRSGIAATGGIMGVCNVDSGTTTARENYNTGTISSQSMGTSQNSAAGGIAGILQGYYHLENVYNNGAVSSSAVGTGSAGGIVGNFIQNISWGSVKQSYNTGKVLSSGNAGGIYGTYSYSYVRFTDTFVNGYSIGASKLGNQTDVMTNCINYESNPSMMEKQSTYSGFDFSSVWEMLTDGSYVYPSLRNNPRPVAEEEDDQTKDDIESIDYLIKDYYTEGDFDGTLFSQSSSVYNHELARYSLMLATTAYGCNCTEDDCEKYRAVIGQDEFGQDIIEEIPSEDNYVKDYLMLLGFDPNTYCSEKYDEYTQENSIATAMAMKTVEIDGESQNVLAVAVRGGDYHLEWGGNFNVGSGAGLVEEHKGFEEAATQVYERITDYLNNNPYNDSSPIIWITGFSRAAATVNLTAAMLNRIGLSDRVYAYGFATPKGAYGIEDSLEQSSGMHSNIWNIVNRSDIVPYVALDQWSFFRFGNTLYLPTDLTDYHYTDTLFSIASNYFAQISKKMTYKAMDHQSIAVQKLTDILNYVLTSRIEVSIYDDYLQTLMRIAESSHDGDIITLPDDLIKAGKGFSDFIQLSKTLKTDFKQIADWMDELICGYSNSNVNSDGKISGVKFKYLLCKIIFALCHVEGEIIGDELTEDILALFDRKWSEIKAAEEYYYVYQYLSDVGGYCFGSHTPEAYIAWMNSFSEDELFHPGTCPYRIIDIACPVDVSVYDPTGKLVAQVIDGRITKDTLGVVLSGDMKTIYVPGDTEFSVKITATDDGAMDYVVHEFDYDGNETRKICFDDIELTNGQVFTGTIPTGNEVEADEYALNSNNHISELTGEYTGSVSITVSYNEDEGIAIGTQVVSAYDYCTIKAFPNKGYVFDGWYVDGVLVSIDQEYSFNATENTEFVAVFSRKVPVEEIILSQTECELYTGNTLTLIASIVPENASLKDITWQSYDTSVATITDNGTIVGWNEGTAKITATVDGQTSECTVTVKSGPCVRLRFSSLPEYPSEEWAGHNWLLRKLRVTGKDDVYLLDVWDSRDGKPYENAYLVSKDSYGFEYMIEGVPDGGVVDVFHYIVANNQWEAPCGGEAYNNWIVEKGSSYMAYSGYCFLNDLDEPNYDDLLGCELVASSLNVIDSKGNSLFVGVPFTYTANHDFSKKVEDEAHYVKDSGNDCQHQKEYYYNCEFCDAIGNDSWNSDDYGDHDYEETEWGYKDVIGHAHVCKVEGCNEHSEIIPHTPGAAATETEPQVCTECGYVITPATGHITHTADTSKWLSDGTNHWHKCIGCDEQLDAGVHTGGTATCQEKAKCSVCGSEYGDFASHAYDLTEWGYKGADGHAHVCKTDGCGEHSTIIPHTPGAAATETEPQVCTECDYVIAPATGHISHTADTSKWLSDGTNHWHKCIGCDEQLDVEAHTGAKATCQEKAKCSVCGEYYGSYGDHVWTRKIEDDAHLASTGDCQTHKTYYYTCANCEAVSTTLTFEGTAYGGHHMATAWSAENGQHWHACTVPECDYKEDLANCSGGTATCQEKAKCSLCGSEYGNFASHAYDLTEWSYKGADGHAHVCKTDDCGEHDTVIPHTPGPAATETEPQVCTECGYVIAPATGHITHTADTSKWLSDETNHWHKCTGCEEKMDKSVHDFGEWVVIRNATETTTGLKERICDTCRYKEEKTIPVKEPTHVHSFTIEDDDDVYLKIPADCTHAAAYYKSCECGEASTTETFVSGSPLGHNWGVWISIGSSMHQRVCRNDPSHVETENHHMHGNTCVDCGYVESSGGGYIPTIYTLTFNTNGGSAIRSVSGIYGLIIGVDTFVPTKDGFDFGGWYTDSALTNPVDEIKLTGNKTVYAKWIDRFPFIDVFKSDSFYGDVAYVYDKGLMIGVSDTEFAPYTTLSRAMIVTILYRLEGEPAFMNDNVFEDVETGSWYEKAVVWANGKGIVLGYGDGRFGPTDPVTREQMAAILYRYAQYKGYDVTIDENTNFLSYDDVFGIDEWAQAPMFWALDNDLIEDENGWLYPRDNATRAVVATFFRRFCEAFIK